MRFINRKWVQIFIIGLILLGVMERVLLITNNINLIPTVILLGSFSIPITFITYLYETLPNWEAAIPEMFICFLWGGAVGVVVAGFLEFNVLQTLGFLPMLAVGLIEEGAKLILPLGFYFKGRLRSEATGILLGTSSAMGFAAMETMGYAFVTLLQSRGNLLVLDSVLFARGVFSPAGHAAWTGLVCAILWQQRLKTNRTGLSWPVIVAFGTAVLLHALWDIFNSLRGTTFIGAIRVELLSLAIAVISVMLLNKRINEAR
jgi:protease PrsW